MYMYRSAKVVFPTLNSKISRLMKSTNVKRELCAAMSKSEDRGIKAVIFDIGGVFVPLVFAPIFEELEKKNNLAPLTIFSALREADKDDGPFYNLQCGKTTETEFGVQFSEFVSKKVGHKVDLTSLMVDFESRKLARSVSSVMVDAVRCIRAEGLRTAVLTNNWFNFSGKTDIQVNTELFDVIVESCREGIKKPSPAIYQRVLSRLDLQPHQTVFVDDLQVNVEAANKLGIHGILFENEAQVLRDLEAVLGFSVRGYVEGTTSVPHRLCLNEERLRSYMEDTLQLHDDVAPTVRCFSHGQSNPTYYVHYGGQKMVLRKKPPGKLLPSAHAVEREHRVIQALQDQDVPVPRVLALCEDSSVIGTPFYLMSYVSGRIFTDPLLPGLSPSERRSIYLEMIRVLAQIHSVDISAAGLDSYGRRDGRFVVRNFERWYRQYDMSRTNTEPAVMEELADWLKANLPTQADTTLVHGDYRLDNLVFHSDRAEVVAVLDWELSTLGDPLTDLSQLCMVYHAPEGMSMGSVTGISEESARSLGIPTSSEVTAHYCTEVGRAGLPHWPVYLAYTFFRLAAIIQGVYKRYTQGQAASPSAEFMGPAVKFMADIGMSLAKQNAKL